MIFRKYTTLLTVVSLAVFLAASCGKKDDGAKKGETPKSDGGLAEIAKSATRAFTVDDEFAEAREVIEEAGFKVKSYKPFPVQEVGKKGRMLVYTDKRGKRSSGMIYVKKTGAEIGPAWHWYFSDMVPDSVVFREINGDGLWDVRFVSTKGETHDFIQDETFTLLAKERSDWMALNGVSSAPVTDEFPLWKCFDGDTTTAWISSLSEPEVFLEFDVPFGAESGILSLQSLEAGQPKGCAVYADGKRIKEFNLEPVLSPQMIQLGGDVVGAKRVRLVFDSRHGSGDMIAVSELSFK
jgi:hypothetical protein